MAFPDSPDKSCSNWASTIRFKPKEVLSPWNLAELKQIVSDISAKHEEVRAVGHGCSLPSALLNVQNILNTDHLSSLFEIRDKS